MEKNKQLDELPYIGKEFSVSFELFLDNLPAADVPYANVLHIGLGADNTVMGDRNPAVWVTGGKEIHITSSISGNKNSWENYPRKCYAKTK